MMYTLVIFLLQYQNDHTNVCDEDMVKGHLSSWCQKATKKHVIEEVNRRVAANKPFLPIFTIERR